MTTTMDFLNGQTESEFYTNEVCSVFDDYGIEGDYTRSAVTKNVYKWLNEKSILINMLRKHPNWNEQAKAVILKTTEYRNLLSDDDLWDKFCNFKNLLCRSLNWANYDFMGIIHTLLCSKCTVVDENIINMINKYEFTEYFKEHKININIGRKKTRVLGDMLRHCCVSVPNNTVGDSVAVDLSFRNVNDIDSIIYQGIDYSTVYYHNGTQLKLDKIYLRQVLHNFKLSKQGERALETYEENSSEYLLKALQWHYDKTFAELCDGMSQITVTKISVLSVNICDYLLMSNGNSWSSCHSLNRNGAYNGCYKAGCFSYAMDDVTMVFYTIDENYSGDRYYYQPKHTRQLFMYNDGSLLQSRAYPDHNNTSRNNQVRNLVQSIIADSLNTPNLWHKPSDQDDCIYYHVTRNCDEWTYFYEDYYHFRDECCFTYLLSHKDNISDIVIGNSYYCIDCGWLKQDDPDDDEARSILQCVRCGTDKLICKSCGCIIDEDDAYCVDGYYYCDDCVERCSCCDEPYVVNNLTQYAQYDGCIVELCEYCRSYEYSWCDRCDLLVSNGEAIYVQGLGDSVCPNCLQDLIEDEVIVEEYESGEYILRENAIEIDGRYYDIESDIAKKYLENIDVEVLV